MKIRQVFNYSNDSHGGLTSRDIAAATMALFEANTMDYLESRVGQVQYFGTQLKKAGVPIVWPPGGHAVYIKVNELFPDRKWNDFMGVGFCVELLRRYGVRCLE